MIKNKLQQDQIKALKQSDKQRLSVIRYILSQVKNAEIKKQKELQDEDVINVLRKLAKEVSDVIELARKSNRSELVEENEEQLKVIKSYLPAEASDETLKKEIKKIIAQNKELYERNANAVMGKCIGKLKNKASTQRITFIFKSLQQDEAGV